MTNPTSNYSFQMPTATDLVTDLPADFEVFGQAVDTRLKALQPGTTLGDLAYSSATANTNTRLGIGTNGQVLGVVGGVPAWTTDAAGMTNPMTTTGDTIYSSSGSTPARLGIGSTGNVLTVSGGLPVWAAPAGGGKVLQVVMGTTSTLVTNATTTHADSGLSLAITPSAATSKVLVLVSQNFGASRLQEETGVNVRLVRTSTTIMSNPQWMEYRTGTQSANTTEFNQTGPMIYLDSPATTSATTYKTQFATLITTNSGESYANQGSSLATMILLEIGA